MSYEAIVIGLLTSVAAIVGALFWKLLVHPEDTLAHWSDRAVTDDSWFDHNPAAVRALRTVGAGLLFVLGFVTGYALTFLTQTG